MIRELGKDHAVDLLNKSWSLGDRLILLNSELAVDTLKANITRTLSILADTSIHALAKTFRYLNWSGFKIYTSVLVSFFCTPFNLQKTSVANKVAWDFEFFCFKWILIAPAWETTIFCLRFICQLDNLEV